MPLKEKAVGSNRKTPKVTSLSFLYQKEKGMPCQPLHKAITQSDNFGDQDSVIARTHLDFPFMCKQQCFVFLKVAIYQHGKPGFWSQDKKESTWKDVWQNPSPDSSFRVTQAVTEQLASLATANWPFYSQ